MPLFDPAAEPLSGEVLDINEYVRTHAGYPLYDAQLAVAPYFFYVYNQATVFPAKAFGMERKTSQ